MISNREGMIRTRMIRARTNPTRTAAMAVKAEIRAVNKVALQFGRAS